MACAAALLVAIDDPAITLADSPPSAPARTSVHVHSSARCRECHARQRDEWAASAHAGAATGAFRRSLEHVPQAEHVGCLGCHVPLTGSPAPVAAEGVACDACHTATGPGVPPAALLLRPDLATKFGPYPDSEDHHFHRVAHSEFVTSSRICIACHDDRAGGPVAVLTSTREWRQSRHAAKACQSCHMRTSRAPAAKGGAIRTVYAHGFGADRAAALSGALRLAARASRQGNQAVLTVRLTNAGAGHAVPTDLPERRLRLSVAGRSGDGETVFHGARVYGRRLVDASGRPAPFFRAVREESDTRLASGETRSERLELPPNVTRLLLRLTYERWDPVFDEYYGPGESVLVFEREVRVR
jgi:hypothetical protein